MKPIRADLAMARAGSFGAALIAQVALGATGAEASHIQKGLKRNDYSCPGG